MAAAESVAQQSVHEFRLRVMLPVVVVTLGAVLLAAFGLYWATTRGDQISIDRQVREVRNAIKSAVEDVIQTQKSAAIWDDAVLELRKSDPDWHWVDEKLGGWLRTRFDHHQVYILNSDDMPVYAMDDGVRVKPAQFEAIRAASRHLVDRVRGRPVEPGRNGGQAGFWVSSSNDTETGEGPLAASDVLSVFGHPAAVSAMRNVPMTEKVNRTPGQEPVMISVRFLDGIFLQQLAKRHLIDSPRFSTSAAQEPGEQTLPLLAADGGLIGTIFWRPDLPGSKLLLALAPITALTIGAMVLLMGMLAHWLLRSRRQQQATMDELKNAMIELKANETQAQHLAFHDPLTGLPNRAMFTDRLDQTLAEGNPATVLLLDLDRFKHVNDTLGHAAGDALIRDFGCRLMEIVRSSDIVARLGGDEFAVLCRDLRGQSDIEALSQRLVETVRRPFTLLGSHVFVGVSVGVSTASVGTSDRLELMRKADIALYRAKADGRDCYRLFTPAMDDAVKMRGTIEEELRTALTTGEGLVVYYQPQVSCNNQAMVGLEALVRWQHPTRGLISPQQFIHVAEETGLICRLGEWVLQQSCMVSQRWPELFMAVNFSPVQFRSPGFADRVLQIVRDSGADPRRIELEVTESVLLDDGTIVREALDQLRAAGFRVALDDFGTGYSSLSYLRQFAVDKIKIDRSFVQPLWQSVDAAAIVTAILTLGHAMGLTVTAEGVETPDQHRFLKAAGCDMMQGYLFSPAVPEANIADFIAAGDFTRGAA
jgi:diguanylate cyclase (GGDEF)-like protein